MKSILFILLLFAGCNDPMRDEIDSLRAGDRWKPEYSKVGSMMLVESTKEYTKYQYNYSRWTYYTVKNDTIVAVWTRGTVLQ